jgi:hypothetical protein
MADETATIDGPGGLETETEGFPEGGLESPKTLEAEGDFSTPTLLKLMTPEIVILIWAVILDIIPIILVCFGLDDFWTIDILGMLTISLWSFLRSQSMVVPQRVSAKAKKGLGKIFRGKWSKFLTPIIGEVVPYLGIGPWWTLSVYYQLTA